MVRAFISGKLMSLQILRTSMLWMNDRGPSVTLGYVHNEEANKKAFTADGWFRTGDLGFVRYLEDSTGINSRSGPWLGLTGRLKEMINKGGEKVSPAEVENVALTEERVQLAVCFSMPDDTYGEQVALVLVPKTPLKGLKLILNLQGKNKCLTEYEILFSFSCSHSKLLVTLKSR